MKSACNQPPLSHARAKIKRSARRSFPYRLLRATLLRVGPVLEADEVVRVDDAQDSAILNRLLQWHKRWSTLKACS